LAQGEAFADDLAVGVDVLLHKAEDLHNSALACSLGREDQGKLTDPGSTDGGNHCPGDLADEAVSDSRMF
jgi:hypothetical protein